ncbi:MAG: choice-of-anchor J domain-containing protein [Xanthobacteraceae bacterium]
MNVSIESSFTARNVMRAFALSLGLALLSSEGWSAPVLTENFDSPAFPGWTIINRSNPVGSTDWFQGDGSILTAQQGAPESYAAANFNNTGTNGTISDWLVSSTIPLANGDILRFYTMTEPGSGFPDRLQVRLSTNGAAFTVGSSETSVGDFTTLLADINPGLAVGGYPENWTLYTVVLSGLPASATGHLAFRYFVDDAGLFGNNSDYIGLDTVSLDSAEIATPLPGALPLFVTGLGGLGLLGWRRKRTVSA